MLNANAEDHFAFFVVWSLISLQTVNVLRSGRRKTLLRVLIFNGLWQTRNRVHLVSGKLRKIKVAIIWLVERVNMSSVGFVLTNGKTMGKPLEAITNATSLKSFKKMISSWANKRRLRKRSMNFRDTCFTSKGTTTITKLKSMPETCCQWLRARWSCCISIKTTLFKSSNFCTMHALL